MLNGFKNPGRVVLIGGNSEIGLAIINQLPENNSREIIAVGRSGEFALDVTEKAGRERIAAKLFEKGDVDLVVIAVGLLGNDSSQSTADNLVAAMEVNYVGTAHLLELISEEMKKQAHGQLLVISSFAQVRPRPDNFRYG